MPHWRQRPSRLPSALITLATERGVSPTAGAWAFGLGGAGLTLGRILCLTLARHTGVTTRAFVLIALGETTTAAFAAVPGPFPLLVMIAIAAGMVRGNLAVCAPGHRRNRPLGHRPLRAPAP